MKKFLMAAGMLALVACGEKKADGISATPTTTTDSIAKADSLARMAARDSIVKDSVTKDSLAKATMAKPPAKP